MQQNLQSYFIGNRFDFTRWLRDQGLQHGTEQIQFVAKISGQYPNTVQTWGNQFERMPEFFQGMVIGYVIAGQNQQPQAFYPHPGFNWSNGMMGVSQAGMMRY
jgi:hypothetical protein